MQSNRYNASWWSKDNDADWDRVKEAFRRDWKQTKHDLGGKSPDLHQNVDDTVKQAAGKQPIPPGNVPNFEALEPAFCFGYGARRQYAKDHPSWDERLEKTLQKDWSVKGDDENWRRNLSAIRSGYEYSGSSRS